MLGAPLGPLPAAPARPLGAALAALLLVVLGGCGGGDAEAGAAPAESSTSPTSSAPTSSPAAASPSGSDETDGADGDAVPAPPRPARPEATRDRQGARDFAEFVVARWGYALTTNEAEALTALSGRQPCQGCRGLATELKERRKEGWYVDLPALDVRKVTVRRDGPRGTYRASARVRIPESRSYFDDGTYRNDNDAQTVTFAVRMRFAEKPRDRFVLLTYRVT